MFYFPFLLLLPFVTPHPALALLIYLVYLPAK